MNSEKYFDWARGAALSEAHGCSWEVWLTSPERYSFSYHPDGFLVFLEPQEIQSLDEYADGDPYHLEEELGDAFQQRRLRVTVDLVKLALAAGPESAKILDVGCGQGHLTNVVHQAFPKAELSGIDSSLTAICYANKYFRGIDFCVGNAFDLPYHQYYFDLVICNNIWEHVSDPLRMLFSVKRVLHPSGYLLVSTPSRYRFDNLVRAITGWPTEFVSRHHVTEYTVGQVTEQLTYGGFKIVLIEGKPERLWADSTLKTFIKYRVLMAVVCFYTKAVRSRNSLATTVFYLARKADAS